ncbi:M50 family metallopeptidase [Evansella sp. AB-P1]|uniref:M50 family metallopeptidase n=1 Tax=Evansella sp. AB-P1 TaxID=3037653 RepID=UPI00241D08C2|nr:M50 family metallopeptidase [Evansella sp. AB-P1]MDG5786844.1 M50 family metallopeptidase [Evansella sp. AB-P1]
MISLFRKIKIHPIFWAILGVGGLTGLFKEVVMLFFIVFVHELGHSIMAYHYRWRIKKILLLPFGGMAETEEYGNRPVKEEVLVIICGPLQHIWLIIVSYFLINTPLWSEADHQQFVFYNLTILIFNLLPILPLDGGKLLFSLFSYFSPFHKAYRISFHSSILLLVVLTAFSLIYIPFHLNLIVIVIFLWVHHYLEYKQRHFMFIRFLLERRKVPPPPLEKRLKVLPTLTVADAMKEVNRQKYHLFIIGNNGVILEEKEVLEAFFNEKKRFLPLLKLL